MSEFKILPVESLAFAKNGEKVAEIKFSKGEAVLSKREGDSERLTVNSEHMMYRVLYLCYAVDYDAVDCTKYTHGYSQAPKWYTVSLIAFNSNKFGLKLLINGLPMYSEELKSRYIVYTR